MRLFFLGLVLVWGWAVPAQAQNSITVPEQSWCIHEGSTIWSARNPRQHDLARLTVDVRCLDDEPTWVRVKAETRCGRALCTWSFAEEAQIEGGRLIAIFWTFTATRMMRVELTGNQISVFVENTYNQTDRESDTLRATMRLDG